MLVVLTGGARSGKSTAAVAAAEASGGAVTFIATAEARDAEMAERIQLHQSARPAGWTTLEAPSDLTAAIETVDAGATIVIDCLAMWVSNRLLAVAPDVSSTVTDPTWIADGVRELAQTLTAEARHCANALAARNGTSIVVTNEVGSGVVPATPLGRAFRDLLGSVNQAITASADRAYLVVAGRLLELRDPSDGV